MAIRGEGVRYAGVFGLYELFVYRIVEALDQSIRFVRSRYQRQERTGPVRVEFDFDDQVPMRSVIGRFWAVARPAERSKADSIDDTIFTGL